MRGRVDGRLHEWVGRWMSELSGWIDEWIDGRMKG